MTPSEPRVSIVMPAYEEGKAIVRVLDRIVEAVQLPHEILVVCDDPGDSTVPVIEDYHVENATVRVLVNQRGPGPANAIRYGAEQVQAPVMVVTMADGSDDPRQVDTLCHLVDRGVAVAAASRYMPGGQQVGGPAFKSFLSKAAGLSLYYLCRIGTRDATNSFKAYDVEFVRRVGIESDRGFEIGMELTAKARRLRLPIAEIPTIWLERVEGVSSFKVATWIPRYLRWYRFAFGRRLTYEEIKDMTP